MVSQTNIWMKPSVFFRKAEKLGSIWDTDMAMVKLNLAELGPKTEKGSYFLKSQKLDKHNMLNEQIKMMQQQMKKMSSKTAVRSSRPWRKFR